MKTIAIIGSNGQLGTDLVKVFSSKNWDVIPINHAQIQIENLESVRTTFSNIHFDFVVNTAAFHKVDECEKNPARAWSTNSIGALNVAREANSKAAKAIFISTDYVFDGNSDTPYSFTDLVSPINVYGSSKVAGELATMATLENKNLVVRISSVFGAAGSSGKGGNFVEAIISKAKSGEDLSVVDDIIMSPTYTHDAALEIFNALDNSVSGVLHASNSGSTTWYSFAKEILRQTGLHANLKPKKTDWAQLPMRPRNSALEPSSAIAPWWVDGLNRYLIEKGHI